MRTRKRFWTLSDLAFARRNVTASERTVMEAIAVYETEPRPLTRARAMQLDGLEEIVRVRFGHGAELAHSHHRPRVGSRGRLRCGRRSNGSTHV